MMLSILVLLKNIENKIVRILKHTSSLWRLSYKFYFLGFHSLILFAVSFSHIYSYCLITFIIKMTMQVNLSIFWDGKQNTYSSYIVNRLSPYFYLLIFREQVNNSLFFFFLLAFPSRAYLLLTGFFSSFFLFFSLFQVVSHFHSLDGNIRIEAMHKSNEAKPRTIKFIACKMEIFTWL